MRSYGGGLPLWTPRRRHRMTRDAFVVVMQRISLIATVVSVRSWRQASGRVKGSVSTLTSRGSRMRLLWLHTCRASCHRTASDCGTVATESSGAGSVCRLVSCLSGTRLQWGTAHRGMCASGRYGAAWLTRAIVARTYPSLTADGSPRIRDAYGANLCVASTTWC